MVQFVQVSGRPPRGYMDHVPSQPTSDMLTVLVVDDDRELRESLSAFLRHRGCSVTAAAGGVGGPRGATFPALSPAGPSPHPPRPVRGSRATSTPSPRLCRRLALSTGRARGSRAPA